MSLGRWLLTHSLSLFLVAMLLAAWFWRDELELDRAWSQLRQQAALDDSKSGKTLNGPTRKQGEQAEQNRQTSKEEKNVGKEKVLPSASAVDKARHPVQAGDEERNTSSFPVDKGKASPPPGQVATDSRLQMARKAFWSRDFDRAIGLYRQLVEAHPDNPDYIGELGNIYYNLNRFEDAAEMFLRAGKLLVKQGETQRARLLLPALMSLDRARGKELEDLLKKSEETTG